MRALHPSLANPSQTPYSVTIHPHSQAAQAQAATVYAPVQPVLAHPVQTLPPQYAQPATAANMGPRALFPIPGAAAVGHSQFYAAYDNPGVQYATVGGPVQYVATAPQQQQQSGGDKGSMEGIVHAASGGAPGGQAHFSSSLGQLNLKSSASHGPYARHTAKMQPHQAMSVDGFGGFPGQRMQYTLHTVPPDYIVE